MICNVCGGTDWNFVRRYIKPDKYESLVNIEEPVCRAWWRCGDCGFFKCRHNYDVSKLQAIYLNGYRAEGFRGKTVRALYDKIISYPYDESENKKRIEWFESTVGKTPWERSLLDVGAGLGVFAGELLANPDSFWDVSAIEPNFESVRFMNQELGVKCYEGTYDGVGLRKEFDVVSCVHTLEHMTDPESFLVQVCALNLKPRGKLFVEVPDAFEFEYLPDNHDEFNSCHFYFFTYNTLAGLVESSGYHVTDIHRVHTGARNLSRIMLMAEKND